MTSVCNFFVFKVLAMTKTKSAFCPDKMRISQKQDRHFVFPKSVFVFFGTYRRKFILLQTTARSDET